MTAGESLNPSSRTPGRFIPMDDIIGKLADILRERRNADPETSYVAGLHASGLNKILEKVGEEATETILAAKDADTSGNVDDVIRETADLWFHTMVMLGHLDASPMDVVKELERRLGRSGLAEKAARSQ